MNISEKWLLILSNLIELSEVDYVPRIWLCNLQKIKDKALAECSWPPGYIKNISRAKDMGMEPNEDWHDTENIQCGY